MESNPLEQQNRESQKNLEDLKKEIGKVFDAGKEEIKIRIDKFIKGIDAYERAGMMINKEEFINNLHTAEDIEDKELFIEKMIEATKPLLSFKINNPRAFEEAQRNLILSKGENIKLSKLLYTDMRGHDNEVFIHLAEASELIKNEGLSVFKKEIIEGLEELAKIVKTNENILRISAISWIVAKNPILLEKLGFTIDGEISKEEKAMNFENEERLVARAHISREDFLKRYSSPETNYQQS
ncbi:MAG: hypothetical protein NDI62_02560 [Burkholderiales bacterium]|nr:hypothetical protein [Burkholderiales bacterium]